MNRVRLGKLPLWIILPLLVVAVAVALWRPGERSSTGSALEGRLLDLRYQLRGPLPASDSIVIAALDDRTIETLQRFPVPRDTIAAAITALARDNAQTIAVDLLLAERSALPQAAGSPDPDGSLAEAIREAGVVILAASAARGGAQPAGEALELLHRSTFALVFDKGQSPPIADAPPGMILPLTEFARAASTGHVNVATDLDGSLNRIPLALRLADGSYLPALSLEAVRQYLELPRESVVLKPGKSVTLGSRRLPTDALGRAMVNYYGGREAFQTVSLIDIVEGKVDAGRFDGKLVFVGSTASGFGDLFDTPFDIALPGVAAHATLAANLLGGSLPLRDRETWIFELALALTTAIFAFLATNMRSLVLVLPAVLAAGASIAFVLQAAFSTGGMWLDAVSQICVFVIVCVATLTMRFAQQRKQAQLFARERDNLAHYQSPLLADWLAEHANPGFDEHIREAAVLFVDVASFTLTAEALGPRRTSEFLRDLHAMFEAAVTPHGGVITEFIGDGAMIVFGLPQAAPDDAARALQAALELLRQAPELTVTLPDATEIAVTLRVSVHSGPVIAAVLGGKQQGHLTVSGDTVNVASRMQEIAKEHGTPLVVSGQALERARKLLPPAMIADFSPSPHHAVRGRKADIDVWLWNARENVSVK